ncbi:DENN domain-containing protein 5B [Galendromus occidentalis]|uniref:DENN domain-containing protein 5B n=1 Tax=Galendromus occidentalis TaxID=34638 RepID=A0AAJ7WI66_9ACAR|nr:DENN domain-containing protein 5B [Galendromus occidentalis]
MEANEPQHTETRALSSATNSKRLVDYVVVCGLDLNSGLEPDVHQGDQPHVTPLERCYKSQALVHFPESVEGHTLDPSAVNMLCLPSGLTFCTQKKMKTMDSNSWFHTFIVTREDGSRSYGHALLFYEEVGDRDMCTALQTLQQMYLAELNESRAQNSGIISRSLPRSFRLLSPKLATKKVHNEPTGSLYDPNKDTLYVTKAICLISSVPIVSVAKVILQTLYRMITAIESPPLPYECYLYNVLYELPMPDRGKSVQLCYPYDEIIFQMPGSMELPHFDYPFRELILLLGVDNLLQLFTSVLFENQVLLCASDFYKLMLVAECVTTLLFPFQWQHVYVPVLPDQLYDFLDAPVPYIMGLCTAGHSTEMLANIVPGEANLCLVDLDNGCVKVPEDLPAFPHRQELARELTETFINVFKLPLPDKRKISDLETNGALSVSSTAVAPVVVAPNDEPRTPDRDKKRRSSKKHSLPFLDISVDMEKPNLRERASFSGILPTPPTLSQHSDVFHKVHAKAKKAVDTQDNLRKSRKKSTGNTEEHLLLKSPAICGTPMNPALEDLAINNAIREIFLNRFLSMFCNYEQFVVLPANEKKSETSSNLADIENWLTNSRETPLQNFDKTSFLSDQPQQHLAFLSKFIETQMFTSFVDAKILYQGQLDNANEELDSKNPPGSSNERNVLIFDARIIAFKEQNGGEIDRYFRCGSFMQSFKPIELRMSCPDTILGAPKRPQEAMVYSQHKPGVFQHWTLNRGYLNGTGPTEYRRRRSSSERGDRDSFDGHLTAHQQRRRSSKQRIIQETASAAVIAQSNWKFVEQLLAECKQKTKRMCVEKMGHAEAIEMGHKRASDSCKTSTIEENTLIAGLCDLLERIWSHGLQTKQGKSALWAHLQNFLEIEDGKKLSTGGMESKYLSPAIAWCALHSKMDFHPAVKKSAFASAPVTPLAYGSQHKAARKGSDLNGSKYVIKNTSTPQKSMDSFENLFSRTIWALGEKIFPAIAPPRRHSATPSLGDPLAPLAAALSNDIRFIQAMEEVKTDIGFARAWVRLSLEKKCLSRHLKTLLANQELLRNLYKRHAFLRSEDEKEYFLHYLLTLNAIDYSCFSNSYTNTVMPYRVTIFPGRRSLGGCTSASVWVTVNGTLAHTDKPLTLPKPSLEMVFKARNLGILTTLRIGHDGTGNTPNILVEHVLVRNEVTGQCYRFPSGRWLGKGVDDGSSERLLFAEFIPLGTTDTELCEVCKAPPKTRMPAVPWRVGEPRPSGEDVQQWLANAINKMVKHHNGPQSERVNLTILMCGEYGLLFALEQVFYHGYRVCSGRSRFFGQLTLWDFMLKVKAFFKTFLGENEATLEPKRRDELLNVMSGFIKLVDKIEGAASYTIGKDQRFQAFMCITIRDHFLHRMLVHVASTPVTSQLYQENSFFRDSSLLSVLVQTLESLNQIDYSSLEKCLTLNIL